MSAPPPAGGADKKLTLDDFEMGNTLGEGSYGIVSLGTLKTTGQKFAIKVLDKKQLVKENKVQAVSRERNILNSMNHPFVVKLFYAMQDPANLYFVMEYCQGGELFHYIKKLGAFNLECAIFYTAEIVVSLEYIHGKGIIHRDLKPENILLGSDGHIKLIDFGTAKDIGTGDVNKARSDSFCGTAEYVSPELLNEKPASPGSDLWALGCIIYQLICGRPPFKGKTQYQTFQLVSKGQFTYPPNFPQKAKDIINKLLVLNPEQRLGYGTTTYANMKADPFFANVIPSWESVHTLTPPVLKAPAIKPIFPNEEESKRKNTIMVKSKSAIPFNIEDLPDKYLLKVLFYLPFQDLLRVSQVCKRLQTLTLSAQIWDYWLSYYQKPLQEAASVDESGSMESELEDLNIDPQTNQVLSASTNKLVDFLASETSIDFSFQRTFLLTYQTFMTPQSLLLGFFRRYNNIYPVLPRLLRLVSVLKTWLDLYFHRDFDAKMIMALKVFIRGKLMYDAKPTVAQNLANSLTKNLNPQARKKMNQPQNAPPPKLTKVPDGALWSDIPEEELARQMTLGDFELFSNIESAELFNLNWTNEKATELSPNVCKMIHRFKLLCQWVPTVVVKADKLKDRVKILARIVRIAKFLRELNNFYGLMACMAGINCGAISRLKFTLDALPKEERKILAILEAEMGQENIHTKYRETLSKISPPCIPYLGMLLKDLTIVEQANANSINGLINFRKRRLMYNVISLLDQYQTYKYPNIEVPAVLSLIENMLANVLDDQEAYSASLKIEPRGAKKGEIN